MQKHPGCKKARQSWKNQKIFAAPAHKSKRCDISRPFEIQLFHAATYLQSRAS